MLEDFPHNHHPIGLLLIAPWAQDKEDKHHILIHIQHLNNAVLQHMEHIMQLQRPIMLLITFPSNVVRRQDTWVNPI